MAITAAAESVSTAAAEAAEMASSAGARNLAPPEGGAETSRRDEASPEGGAEGQDDEITRLKREIGRDVAPAGDQRGGTNEDGEAPAWGQRRNAPTGATWSAGHILGWFW